MVRMSIPHTLLDVIQAAPGDQTAIIVPESGLRISYQQLRDQVTAMSDALASLGIQRGDRIATSLPNGLPAIVSFLAASIAGTAAPLNPGYREDEVSFYLEDTAAKVLLCPPEGQAEARKAAEARGVPVYTLEMDEKGWVRIAGAGNERSAMKPSPDDTALILHTSGSTGRPKRVPILHRNIAASTQNIVNHYSLSPDDVSLCVMPLFHVHGLVASTLSTFLPAAPLLYPPNSIRFLSGERCAKQRPRGTLPFRLFTISFSRARTRSGLRVLRACASFDRAAHHFLRR